MKANADRMAACGNCGGLGTTQVDIWNPNTRRWQTLTETCSACLGAGRVPD